MTTDSSVISFMKHLIYTVYMDLRETIYYCVILTMYVIKRYDIAVFFNESSLYFNVYQYGISYANFFLMYENI